LAEGRRRAWIEVFQRGRPPAGAPEHQGQVHSEYELEKLNIFKGFKTYRVKTLWTGMHQLGARNKYELLVSNFTLMPTDLYIDKSFIGMGQD
jgi:hypothetical protein